MVGGLSGRVLPLLGMCVLDPADGTVAAQLAGLRDLGLDPRADLRAGEQGELERAVALARALDASLELALHLREGDELGVLGAAEIARAIVVDADARSATPNETASPALIALARRALPAGRPCSRAPT